MNDSVKLTVKDVAMNVEEEKGVVESKMLLLIYESI